MIRDFNGYDKGVIGRIARAFEDKQDPICYDFVDDIGYLFKSYKKRCSTYKKNGCYFVEEGLWQ